jgi:hypothetical protein
MARKTVVWKGEDGRDKGKLYTITEMSAADAEYWALRIGQILLAADSSIAESLVEEGMLGLLKHGFRQIAHLPSEQARDLLNDLLKCVRIHPDKQHAEVSIPWNDDGAEEVATRVKLRVAIFKLHTDFFTNATDAS